MHNYFQVSFRSNLLKCRRVKDGWKKDALAAFLSCLKNFAEQMTSKGVREWWCIKNRYWKLSDYRWKDDRQLCEYWGTIMVQSSVEVKGRASVGGCRRWCGWGCRRMAENSFLQRPPDSGREVSRIGTWTYIISRDTHLILSHSHLFSHSTTFYLLSAFSRAFSWLPYAWKLLANESRPELQPG